MPCMMCGSLCVMWGNRKATDALVFGLGNPGHRHMKTRRSIGRSVVAQMLDGAGVRPETICEGVDGKVVLADQRATCLAMPNTFVAYSAEAMESILDYTRARLTVVVHDVPGLTIGELQESHSAPGAAVPLSLARACPSNTIFVGVGVGTVADGEDYADWLLGDAGASLDEAVTLASDAIWSMVGSRSNSAVSA